MENSFWIGTHLGDFLLKGFTVSSIWGLLATCLGLASLAILYEGGRVYKLTVKPQSPIPRDFDNVPNYDSNLPLASVSGNKSTRINTERRLFVAVMNAVIYIGQDIIGYILMLSVMTMNLGIVIAICLGAGIGYFVFAANIRQAVSAKGSTHCTSGRKRERNLESRSNEDLTAISEYQREEIVEEGAFQIGYVAEHSVNVKNEEPADMPEESSTCTDINQSNVVVSKALIHNEPSW